MTQSKTIDAYLKTVPAQQRAMLEELREAIHATVPGLEECISYGIPAFRHEGKVIAGFAARKGGCSYFPFSGSTLRMLDGNYKGSKSALHFDEPLAKTLVRRLLKARIAEL